MLTDHGAGPVVGRNPELEASIDACGSLRVRDDMRRELRRLGARAEPRGPATPDASGAGRAHEARAGTR